MNAPITASTKYVSSPIHIYIGLVIPARSAVNYKQRLQAEYPAQNEAHAGVGKPRRQALKRTVSIQKVYSPASPTLGLPHPCTPASTRIVAFS